MTDRLDVLTKIDSNLPRTKEPPTFNEQTIKFHFEGRIRSCCRPKALNYAGLMKLIEKLYGENMLLSIESIRCALPPDDRLSFPILNDNDLNQVLTLDSEKVRFFISQRRARASSEILNVHHQNSIDNQQQQQHDTHRVDSPPPGTILRQKQRRFSKSAAPSEGGRFIPESSDEFSSNDLSSRRRSSRKSSVLPMTSSSNLNGTNESFQSNLKTPKNWKLGRLLGHEKG